jgi:hypothetical protein
MNAGTWLIRETPPREPAIVLRDIRAQERVAMSLFRAIYTSRPFGFDTGILNGILLDARRANARDGITGALICRGDIYLQLLEGPEEQVRNTLERIKRDDRHLEVVTHVAERVADRMFGEWAMLHDPAASWIWLQEEVSAGAVERATAKEIMTFFTQLRNSRSADKVD